MIDMRVAKYILLYLLTVLGLSALVSPFVYNFVQALGMDNNVVNWLQSYDFSRYFRRTVMVFALVFLPFFLGRLGVRSWADMGLTAEYEKGSRFVWGIILGGGMIFILTALNLVLGVREFRPEVDAERLWGFAAMALVVAGLEEIFFRAIILTQLRKYMAFWPTLVFGSLFFAVLHFLKPAPDVGNMEITWTSGFELIPKSFVLFTQPLEIATNFTALFLAGMLLGYSFLTKGSIYFCIGIHAGWVFMLRTTTLLTDENKARSVDWAWLCGRGSYDGVIGIVLLLIFWGALIAYENRRSNRANV